MGVNRISWNESEYLLKNDFHEIMNRRIELSDKKKELEEELKQINVEIGVMMMTAGVDSVDFAGRPVSYVEMKGRKRIDPNKLLELGVAANVIAKATIQSGSYWALRVGSVKKQEVEVEEVK